MPTFLSIEEAQQLLPRGLKLKQEVLPHDQRTPGEIGQVFRAEDHRLGDAAVSQIPSWSNGERFANRMRVAFPPEWQQKPKEASLQGDLYALGIVALRLLL